MATHNETGKTGENLAAAWFTSNGYNIIHQNWRYKNLEVDIIAHRNNCLHFIEIKATTTLKFGHPETKVTPKKIKHLIDASEAYLYQYPQWQRIQFDVLAITILPNSNPQYFYIEDVYL
ncbi:YraN family protein [Ferruginibacter yonginensis]|uniref:UPF0102 protein ACFOWM_13600 n=1 Tax=Ferruginibacter yonginensis TaxID=1310416 RepID=A0ABV8QX50_9BACT